MSKKRIFIASIDIPLQILLWVYFFPTTILQFRKRRIFFNAISLTLTALSCFLGKTWLVLYCGLPAGIVLGLLLVLFFRNEEREVRYLPICRLIVLYQVLMLWNSIMLVTVSLYRTVNVVFDLDKPILSFIVIDFSARLPEIIFYMEMFARNRFEVIFSGIIHSMLFKMMIGGGIGTIA